jgi:regulator of replication initiation timing
LARFCELKVQLGKLEDELEALRQEIVESHAEDAEYELGKYKLKVVCQEMVLPDGSTGASREGDRKVQLHVDTLLIY